MRGEFFVKSVFVKGKLLAKQNSSTLSFPKGSSAYPGETASDVKESGGAIHPREQLLIKLGNSPFIATDSPGKCDKNTWKLRAFSPRE